VLLKERLAMPEISRFFGIIIAMFYDEHNPPHFHDFHARYGDAQAAIEIGSLRVLEGGLPPRALASSSNGLLSIKRHC
jgi:hypothetical protein